MTPIPGKIDVIGRLLSARTAADQRALLAELSRHTHVFDSAEGIVTPMTPAEVERALELLGDPCQAHPRGFYCGRPHCPGRETAE